MYGIYGNCIESRIIEYYLPYSKSYNVIYCRFYHRQFHNKEFHFRHTDAWCQIGMIPIHTNIYYRYCYLFINTTLSLFNVTTRE